MLHLIPSPTRMPALRDILSDLGNPTPQKLAKALGVSLRTAQRWCEGGDECNAPFVVLAALYWMTTWGRSNVHTSAHNDAVLYAGYVGALKSQVTALERELAHVLALANTGAANDASQRVRPLARVFPIRG